MMNTGIIYYYIQYSFVGPKDGEFTVTRPLIILVFDQDINEVEQEQVQRFNLYEHDDEVEKRYSETGMQHK